MSNCQRCGRCCQDKGSFWTHSPHELIRQIDENLPLDFYRDGDPCDMLQIDPNGRATCLLQKWLGHKAKPEACRDYPFDGDLCFREKENQSADAGGVSVPPATAESTC
ncbi:MAG: hypothetical protein ACE5JK_07915 [Candidatus Omnitrophota bacterium]